MSTLELVPNMLAEATTTEFSKEMKPSSFEESRKIAKQGGKVAGDARKKYRSNHEKKPVITDKSADELNRIVADHITDIADEE